VGTGARLAIALAPDRVAAEDFGQVLLLLLLGAVDDERGAREADGDAEGARRASFRQLGVEDELLHHAHAGPAVFLRPGGRNPLPLRELLHPLPCALLAERISAPALGRFTSDKFANFLAKSRLFRRVSKIHLRPLRFESRSGMIPPGSPAVSELA